MTIGRQNDEINVAATKPVQRMIGTAACIEAHQLEERDFAPPAAPLSVGALGEATGSFLLVAGPQRWRGDAPHPTPRRQISCVVEGHVRVTVGEGDSREFFPGDLLLLEDTWGEGHATEFLSERVVVAATALIS